MNLPDLINGLFELSAGAFQWLNVRQLLRDKKLMGVHPLPTFFFTSWGVWNLFYYPNLHQWLSFTGGLIIVSINALWLGLLWKFSKGTINEPTS